MATLEEILLAEGNRDRAINTLSAAVNDEVSSKSGLSGAAIKTAFAAAKKVKPNLVPAAVDTLLPQFAEKLQPLWAERGERPFGEVLSAHKSTAADSLLEVTDARMQDPKYAAISKVYNGLRPKAKGLVEDALPRVGAAIQSLA